LEEWHCEEGVEEYVRREEERAEEEEDARDGSRTVVARREDILTGFAQSRPSTPTVRNEKKIISQDLIHVMRNNNLDEFDIKDGQIMYVKKQVKKPINQKQLLSILSNYYK
jgi:hypothetical protein